MPTLIRLFVILLVLVGLAYGAMLALVMMVKPGDKEITIRIPARDLVPAPDRDPLVLREINTTPAEPTSAGDAAPTAETAPRADAVTEMPPAQEPGTGDGSLVTLAPGTE